MVASSVMKHAWRQGWRGATSVVILALVTGTAAWGAPSWDEALEQGLARLAANDPKAAIKPLKKAIKLKKAPCGPCQLALARAHYLTGSFPAARKAASAAVAQTTDPTERLRALNLLGLAEFANGRADTAGLERAEDAFRQVLEAADSNAVRYSLGEVLVRLAKDDEGVALLSAYLEAEPNGTHSERARLLVENPLRARKDLVPAFAATTLDGVPIDSASLEGKVVLIDFWATWCAPCIAALPALERLAKRMEDEPLVVLSVSADRSEEVLRAFLGEHGISWPQVWDRGLRLSKGLFEVTGYPTYVLVDHTGEVIYRVSGGGSAIDTEIARRVSAAVKQAPRDDS